MPVSQSVPLSAAGLKLAPGAPKVYRRHDAFIARDLLALFA
jgi:hypothetical protein